MMTGGFDLAYEVRKMTDLKYEGRNSMHKAPMAGMSKSSGAIQEKAVLWSRGTKTGLEPWGSGKSGVVVVGSSRGILAVVLLCSSLESLPFESGEAFLKQD